MPGMPKKLRFSIPLFLRTSKSWWRSSSFGYPTYLYIYTYIRCPKKTTHLQPIEHGPTIIVMVQLFLRPYRATMSSAMSYLLVWSLFPSHVCELMAYGHHKAIGTSHLAELWCSPAWNWVPIHPETHVSLWNHPFQMLMSGYHELPTDKLRSYSTDVLFPYDT